MDRIVSYHTALTGLRLKVQGNVADTILHYLLTMTASAAFFTLRVEIACQHCSCKEGSAGLVMLQDVPKVSWPRTYFCPHHLAPQESAAAPRFLLLFTQPLIKITTNPIKCFSCWYYCQISLYIVLPSFPSVYAIFLTSRHTRVSDRKFVKIEILFPTQP